jgi:hypothetical protein
VRKDPFDFAVRARNHVNRNELAHPAGGGSAGVGCSLDGADIAANQNGDVAGPDVLGADERDICRLDHGICGLDRPDESPGLNHTERIPLSFHLVDRHDIMALLNMQRTVKHGGLLGSLSLALAVCAATSCGQAEDTSPAIATAEVALERNRVAQGSPVDMTYRFQPAQPISSAHRVFVHVLDVDEELMWTDDHEPATATTAWMPGQTVEYSRTMFVPMYPYVGTAKVVVGLYDKSTNQRLKLGNADRGDRSYQVAQFELLPQTENVYLIYKDGWHPAEVAPENPAIEWKWTRKEATVAFRNPKRDSTFILQMDNPSRATGAATEVELRLGDQTLATFPVAADDAAVRKVPLTAAQLGSGDMVEIRLVANRTFVPALEAGTRSGDTRELGIRVFHAFVQPVS